MHGADLFFFFPNKTGVQRKLSNIHQASILQATYRQSLIKTDTFIQPSQNSKKYNNSMIRTMDLVITQLTTDTSQTPLQKIGQGFCGTVWASAREGGKAGSQIALKREDGGPGRSLLHEHQIHEQLLDELRTNTNTGHVAHFRVNLPFCHGRLEQTSTQWPRILPRLPPGFEPCNALVNEKIPSMPIRVRTLLAGKYHPDSKDELEYISNEHCLVRPYLGRRRHRQQATVATRMRPNRLSVFSLRNFPLHVDQMEELGLDTEKYAIAMADALSFLHWAAMVDANDVEFVLAPPRHAAGAGVGIGSVQFESETLGSHVMWMLDFDCCRPMSMDEAGVRQAATSFKRNDPFYPRFGSTHPADQGLWDKFRSRFLQTSCSILTNREESVRKLPAMLMEEIERLSGGA